MTELGLTSGDRTHLEVHVVVEVRGTGPREKGMNSSHWPFQEPKLEVPTIYKYLHFRILKSPLITVKVQEVLNV